MIRKSPQPVLEKNMLWLTNGAELKFKNSGRLCGAEQNKPRNPPPSAARVPVNTLPDEPGPRPF